MRRQLYWLAIAAICFAAAIVGIHLLNRSDASNPDISYIGLQSDHKVIAATIYLRSTESGIDQSFEISPGDATWLVLASSSFSPGAECSVSPFPEDQELPVELVKTRYLGVQSVGTGSIKTDPVPDGIYIAFIDLSRLPGNFAASEVTVHCKHSLKPYQASFSHRIIRFKYCEVLDIPEHKELDKWRSNSRIFLKTGPEIRALGVSSPFEIDTRYFSMHEEFKLTGGSAAKRDFEFVRVADPVGPNVFISWSDEARVSQRDGLLIGIGALLGLVGACLLESLRPLIERERKHSHKALSSRRPRSGAQH